jgi:septum formation protein
MIYLASASPRRQELLRQMGVAFEVLPSHIDEVPQPQESARDYVLRVAHDKARAVAATVRERGLPPHPVLGADTEVVLDGEVLGKPENEQHGKAMLRRLAGRTHEVLSGVALVHAGGERWALSESRVSFGDMSEAEIGAYWASGEPLGKAGGYAVQGCAAAFIRRIEGSYSGIVGLPLYELKQVFDQAGLRLA